MAKDYYQILGVPRDADENALKRAYRKVGLPCNLLQPSGLGNQMHHLHEVTHGAPHMYRTQLLCRVQDLHQCCTA